MTGGNAFKTADLNFALGQPNNSTRTTAWSLVIPNDLVFLSMHIQLQGLALEFGGTRFATTANGIDARIGNQ